MAFTAHKTDAAMEEIEYPPEKMDQLAKEAADVVRAAKRVVFFTGAGISTSAGIPDYRGPEGAWTLAAQGRQRESRTVSMSSAIATPTHMALVELYRRDKLHLLISQNVDGLHRRSGIPASAMAELHGNTTLEECDTCGFRIGRDFQIHGRHAHYTGRKCVAEGCKGEFRDTIINFGENLPGVELGNGFAHSETADVHICLGSSLTVRPACDMPMATKEKGGKLIIVNLQRTPLDKAADIRVHGRIDDFMIRMMGHLGYPIPEFQLIRHVAVWRKDGDVQLTAVLEDGTPLSLFETITCGDKVCKWENGGKCPMVLPGAAAGANITCKFFGHYGEPDVTVQVPQESEAHAGYVITYDVRSNTLSVQRDDNAVKPPSFAKGSGAVRMKGNSDKAINDGTGIDYSGWFAVTPLRHCGHCEQVSFKDGVVLDPNAACVECGNAGENMQCLTCFEVHCGRHVNQHMLSHHEKTEHPMVVGFADLSFWCYPCEAYIDPSNKHLALIYRLLHNAKFGFEAPHGRSGAPEADAAPPAAGETNKAKEEEEDPNFTGYEVHPLSDCMHCRAVNRSSIPDDVDPATSKCATCGHVGENMICLNCHAVHCGRHANAHMIDHHEQTGHAMVMGFKDLSVWCYMCDNYVDTRQPDIAPAYQAMCRKKGF